MTWVMAGVTVGSLVLKNQQQNKQQKAQSEIDAANARWGDIGKQTNAKAPEQMPWINDLIASGSLIAGDYMKNHPGDAPVATDVGPASVASKYGIEPGYNTSNWENMYQVGKLKGYKD